MTIARFTGQRFMKYLDPVKKEIRLLRIHPLTEAASEHSPLLCSLTIASLEDDIQFDALSYTWDGPEDQQIIHLNGRECIIRRNLFDVLLLFREMNTLETYLWVDALCINQRDIPERNQQVQLMRDIYSRTQMVHIWLGQGIPEVKTLFAGMASVQPDTEAELLLNDRNGCKPALRHLMKQSWWTRLWVVQEVLLAPDALLHCGKATLPWRIFVDFWRRRYEASLRGRIPNEILQGVDSELWDGITSFMPWARIIDVWRRRNIKELEHYHLWTTLWNSAFSQCNRCSRPHLRHIGLITAFNIYSSKL